LVPAFSAVAGEHADHGTLRRPPRGEIPETGVPAEVTQPGRRYERKTKRPGGRYKTRKPGETARLTPLTRIVFWLMPVPDLT
jgi:hypothetical protein